MSINILHLSDIQYGRHHVDKDDKRQRLYPDGNYTPQLLKMKDSLDILASDVRPNFIVVTGDIAEWSLRSEYQLAEEFIGGIADHLHIDRRYVMMVPGNHDIHRKLCQAARLQAEAYGKPFNPPYFKKFRFYVEFFRRFYRQVKWPEGVEPYQFRRDRLFVNFYFPDEGVIFAGLNSCIDESEENPHYGNITFDQLRKATAYLNEKDPEKRMLRIALMHHNFVRLSSYDEENLKDADELKPIFINGDYHLILHGHLHIPRREVFGNGNITIPVLATGSAGLDTDTIPANSRRYQVISMTGNRVRVYRHVFDNAETHYAGPGCWKPDIQPSQRQLYEEFVITHYTAKLPYNLIMKYLTVSSQMQTQVTLGDVLKKFEKDFGVESIFNELQRLKDNGLIRLDDRLNPRDVIEIQKHFDSKV